MKLFKTAKGIVIEKDGRFYPAEATRWNQFVNDDELYRKMEGIISKATPLDNGQDLIADGVEAPLEDQEIWASGVTYYNSKLGREEESEEAGGSDFYARVYDAERPELFFKATKYRTAGPGGFVRIRDDSDWNVPEPELTLMITSNGTIVGYTIGNDMSSRSIEGENPLYLPQAKSYDGSAAIGPCIYVTDKPLPPDTAISLQIKRGGAVVFEDSIEIDQIKRNFSDLVSWLYRECSFPNGCLLMTGTGIVPGNEFTLQHDDEISIKIEPIGTLTNKVR